MSKISRRQMLAWLAAAPAVPQFIVRSAEAAAAQSPAAPAAYDGPVLVVVRFMGGNDGLNAVIPFNDDRYYRARPTIGIAKNQAIPMAGGDLGLNPWLSEYRRVMDDGYAAIVQGVGYPNPSRSHSRGTEIFETASLAEPAPKQGWLGRYVDRFPGPVTGVQFADQLGRTLASASGHSKSIANPDLLLDMKADDFQTAAANRSSRKDDFLQQVENDLGDAARQLRRAAKGSGNTFEYPQTEFGQSLRWTADMIETGSATRVYYLTLGSFATFTSPSFDTHSRELDMHKILYSEFSRGIRAFSEHMRKVRQFDRVLLLSFSEFGRMLEENKSGGTDHGEASMMFVAGGKVRPGLLGKPVDLGRVNKGGLEASVDFRQIYANVLGNWLKVAPREILGETIEPFQVVA